MTYSQVLRHFGGIGRGSLARTSRRLKRSRKTVQAWKARGVPRGVQFELRALSKGKLHVSRA